MLGLCLGLAGTIWAQVPAEQMTLSWTHTIEKIRWAEDYRLTNEGFILEQARVKGSGAGMEIPADAVLKDGSWHYKPHLPILPMLKLGRTPEAGDYQLCVSSTQAGQQCHSMSYWVGEPTTEQPSIELWGCDIPS
ncbi:DUF1850 domain-containing protein [Shewanella frigidimarina]|jgi:hypothetical protein|uniref:DUF1850 domain-containing protein n=1 Tax=Shewanella frigidimarina (strain NCIMB 400) TaxID=318167 RepID=Q07X73_SHEFN|nr:MULTISPECIES: DUF1850 domain-containing protein [Shewanella]MBB1381271.1 DUF1850 domain-containing protein [Shewanella sp. SR41-2]ABI73391.1 conserved hypothetical protein [Shewanella frigidimarina NCIMB 400]MBB1425817.1 DUF1850 domain-containing protein [Shewanella sp. SG44-2]MBO1897431.1 DUF1850 domain-containing protein [Shewanella sp. BF02_Schw]PKH34592.1 DUF1850 domain-containing protein [Shewanella sp. ALD9]|tara:strand:- start:90 stop:494 length:405 start_codon:yes stop_codon:yes gene_type:complete